MRVLGDSESFTCLRPARTSTIQSPSPARIHFTRTPVAILPFPSLPAIPASLLASATHFASTGAGIAILSVIVFIHECGHYLAARLQNIRVKTFSVGFGPTLFSYVPKGSETEFTLRALPLGGFVAFPEHVTVDEETGEEIVSGDRDLLQNRPILDRAIVISAGVIANIILAWATLFTSVSAIGLPHYSTQPGVLISSIVDQNGAASAAGVLPGDIILSVNGTAVEASMDSASFVASQIRTSQGRPLRYHFRRGDSEFDKVIHAKCCSPTGDAAMGIQLLPNAVVTRVPPSSLPEVISQTNGEFIRLSKQTIQGIFTILTHFRESSGNIAGPVGVVAMGANLAASEQTALFTFCAVISLNLAVINSLPLPALDGGQMAFLLIEAITGSPVSLKIQDAVNRAALLFFLLISGVLFLSDLEKLSVVNAFTRMFG